MTLRNNIILYNITLFLNNLIEIRNQILKSGNIISAFIYSEIYLLNLKYIIIYILKYNNKIIKAKKIKEAKKSGFLFLELFL